MVKFLRVRPVLLLLALGSHGCSGSAGPADSKAADVLLAHWENLHRGEWRAA